MQLKYGWAAVAAGAVAAFAAGDIQSIDPEVNAEFGATLATVGATFAVGAPGSERVETGSFVNFMRAIIEAPSPEETMGFGSAIALRTGWCLVGAPESTGGGSAWMFEQLPIGWKSGQKLTAPLIDSGDEYGQAVALSTEFVFVGAPRSMGNGTCEGEVHVFGRTPQSEGWLHQMVLRSGEIEPSPMLWADFGAAVATDGVHLAVGAPGMHEGVCYLFCLPGIGNLPQMTPHISRPVRVEAPEGVGLSFGRSVAIDGDRLVVGAPQQGAHGIVVVFHRQGIAWVVDAVLEPEAGMSFGASVALADGAIIVGDPDASQGGMVWMFVEVGGVWIEQSPAIDHASGDELGAAVGFAAGRLLAGAPGVGGEGIVRVVEVVTCPDCNQNLVCDSDEILSDPSADCNGDGVLDGCQTLADCDGDGIPDECDDGVGGDLPRCLPEDGSIPIQVLVLEDTSGSTNSERAEACATIGVALDAFANVEVAWSRIGAGAGGDGCLEGEPFLIPIGAEVPDCWGGEPRMVENTEDWGDAISFACAQYGWRDDGLRFLLVLTDEGPSHGNAGGDCGGDDLLALELAASIAALQGVQLFPVPLPGTSSCLYDGEHGLMATLAEESVGGVLDARDLDAFFAFEVAARFQAAIEDSPYVEACSPCPADLDGDGMVDANDLLQVIGDWGLADSPADINGDGVVDATDLLAVISGWGPCG